MRLRIHRLYSLRKSKTSPPKRGVLSMKLSCNWGLGSSSRDLGSVECPFTTLTPRSTLTLSDSTCSSLPHWSNNFFRLNLLDKVLHNSICSLPSYLVFTMTFQPMSSAFLRCMLLFLLGGIFGCRIFYFLFYLVSLLSDKNKKNLYTCMVNS